MINKPLRPINPKPARCATATSTSSPVSTCGANRQLFCFFQILCLRFDKLDQFFLSDHVKYHGNRSPRGAGKHPPFLISRHFLFDFCRICQSDRNDCLPDFQRFFLDISALRSLDVRNQMYGLSRCSLNEDSNS